MSNLQDHLDEQDELTAAYEQRELEARQRDLSDLKAHMRDMIDEESRAVVIPAHGGGDPDGMNVMRKNRGMAILDGYPHPYNVENLPDALSDLMHAAHAYRIDFAATLRIACTRFEEETAMPPPRIVTTEEDDIVSRVAPRWAWRAVDAALARIAMDRTAAAVEAQKATAAMVLACEEADDEPISRDDPRLKEVMA